MEKLTALLDTSVLLTAFGSIRNGGSKSFIFSTDAVQRTTFEKCIFESFLAFRGVGGKKPDEGRQDWAKRFLRLEGDPVPLSDAAGKLHFGSIHAAHYWTGQADESQWVLPESFDEYMADVKKHVRPEEWDQAAEIWGNLQNIFDNHRRFQRLFAEFRTFLSDHDVLVISHEDLYTLERRPWRFMTMEGLSQRSTIPNEDFEIVVAALLSEPDLFVSTDRRLLTATASIEANLRRCDFVHLSEVEAYIQSRSAQGYPG
jgi:hypothetical protein